MVGPEIATLLVLALLGLATILGVLSRRRAARIRRTGAVGEELPPRLDLADLKLRGPLGESATLIQFSTTFCAKCPGTARRLSALATPESGLRHFEVDVTERPDLVTRFALRKTPTVLVLDGQARLVATLVGAPTPEQLAEVLAPFRAEAHAAVTAREDTPPENNPTRERETG